MRHKDEDTESFAVHELIDSDGKIGWTEDALTDHCETPQELVEMLEQMLEDIKDLDVKDYE